MLGARCSAWTPAAPLEPASLEDDSVEETPPCNEARAEAAAVAAASADASGVDVFLEGATEDLPSPLFGESSPLLALRGAGDEPRDDACFPLSSLESSPSPSAFRVRARARVVFAIVVMG